MLTTILFDLDGTLLPMDQDAFIKLYFKQLAVHFVPFGLEPEKLCAGVMEGTKAMTQNDGSCTNETRFWNTFAAILGEEIRSLEPEFQRFYKTSFCKAKEATMLSQHAASCVRKLKEKGYSLIIATNPLFPPVATKERIQWAGLSPDDFCYITTYDNSSYCKPNPDYFREILSATGLAGTNCLMVGNDTSEDLSSAETGMDTYLLTDCLIHRGKEPLSAFGTSGNFKEFESFVDHLPVILYLNSDSFGY